MERDHKKARLPGDYKTNTARGSKEQTKNMRTLDGSGSSVRWDAKYNNAAMNTGGKVFRNLT